MGPIIRVAVIFFASLLQTHSGSRNVPTVLEIWLRGLKAAHSDWERDRNPKRKLLLSQELMGLRRRGLAELPELQ